ncbi:MAG: TetR/AcrR family transcriptional regulator [Dehalococcoidales bacterium]|nr:TetR/AcrR family transcriptional regulator [Dehalococcoidales bacterium]
MPRKKEVFQQIRDSRRQNILDKAAEVFASKGIANTKVSELAQAAGVSHGLLYWYFSDKEDVFIALLNQAIAGVMDLVQTATTRTGTPLEKLHWLTEQVILGMAEKPDYFQLFSQAMALTGRVKETLLKLEPIIPVLRELITEGQTSGEIVKRDPEQLVFLYLGCLFGLAAGKSVRLPWIDEHFPSSEAVLQVLKS